MSKTDLAPLCDEALRKIGRNIVNFQRMERAMKLLIVRSDIRGHASRLAKTHKKKTKEIDRKPMGWLVDDFIRTLYTSDQPGGQETRDLGEAWLSFSFKIEKSKDAIRTQRKALSLIVAERNALIHKMLSTFDTASDESCRSLIALLDEQNERLKPHYEAVMRMLGDLNAAQQEVLKQIESLLLPSSGDTGDAA